MITREERRRSLRLAVWNGGLWAIGNGLTSTTLIIYLAMELGAAGLAIGLIVGAPRLIGLVRLATPALLRRVGSRRRFCTFGFTLSSLLLLFLPIYAAPGVLPSRTASLSVLVTLWAGYHLLEYFATIALWSWLGDLAPLRIRGRFLGFRERFLTLGRIVGMLAAGGYTYGYLAAFPWLPRWTAYSVPAAIGAAFMLFSVVPLSKMAEPSRVTKPGPTQRGSILAPFFDARFVRLLLFGLWFSMVNGLTQAAQGIYPHRVLGLAIVWLLLFRSAMYLGQSAVSPWAGRLADQLGNRQVLIVSQILVAAGPLFFFFATPERPWILAFAFVAWIAYAGMNVALPALVLKLSPTLDSSPYIATYFATTGLVYGVSAFAGGALLEGMGVYDELFLFGAAARLLGIVFLLRIIEPGARSFRSQ